MPADILGGQGLRLRRPVAPPEAAQRPAAAAVLCGAQPRAELPEQPRGPWATAAVAGRQSLARLRAQAAAMPVRRERQRAGGCVCDPLGYSSCVSICPSAST